MITAWLTSLSLGGNSICPPPAIQPYSSLFKRHSLCTKKQHYHLGCAHTTARRDFISAVEDLQKLSFIRNNLLQQQREQLNKWAAQTYWTWVVLISFCEKAKFEMIWRK